MTGAIEGRVVCAAIAYSCACVLDPGHDGPHACNPETCGGSWTGSSDSDEFEVVTYPIVGPPAAMDPFLAMLLAGPVTTKRGGISFTDLQGEREP